LAEDGRGGTSSRDLALRLLSGVLAQHQAELDGNGNAKEELGNGDDERDDTYDQPSIYNGRGGFDQIRALSGRNSENGPGRLGSRRPARHRRRSEARLARRAGSRDRDGPGAWVWGTPAGSQRPP
jgi:hypothetical protein